MADLEKVALQNIPPEGLHVEFFDLAVPDHPRFFFRHESRLESRVLPFVSSDLLRSKDFVLQIGNVRWRIVCLPTPAFVERHQTWQPWIVSYIALTMTLGGCVIVNFTVHRALRNERELTDRAKKIECSERLAQRLLGDLRTANQELNQLTLAAQAATQAKSEFLANMSHEIRTPLTAIMGYADVLCGSLPPDEIEFQAAATIERNSGYLLAILNDILDLSKIEAGRFHVERVACSPCRVFAELKSLMDVGAQAKGLQLNIGCDGLLPDTIVTDPIRLRQILVNVIGNAIKFHGNGRSGRLVGSCPNRPTTQNCGSM